MTEAGRGKPMAYDHIKSALDWCKGPDSPKDSLRKPRGSPHYVYFFADQSGAAKYVGITGNLSTRVADHRRNSDWCDDTLEPFWFEAPTRRAALDMEGALIRAMQPLHNVLKQRAKVEQE